MPIINKYKNWGKKSKRQVFEILDNVRVLDGFRLTVRPVYNPSPKSTLRNKSVFSKKKLKIV